jgi:hypothetical protein
MSGSKEQSFGNISDVCHLVQSDVCVPQQDWSTICDPQWEEQRSAG